MNRFWRFTLYSLSCIGILVFPYIAEACIDVCEWLKNTIDTSCLITALCIAALFLYMEFLIQSCKKERENGVAKYLLFDQLMELKSTEHTKEKDA